jgi:intracellular septation protein A
VANRASALVGIAWDIGATLGVYYGLRLAGVSERIALLVATVLAATRLVWVVVRRRQITWFAALMLTVFGLGLLLTFLAGDARFLLLKDSIVTAGVGTVFLLSAVFGRPLTLSAAQTSQPWRAAELDEMFNRRADIRRRFVVSAIVWGVGLLLESVARIPLVYTLPFDTMVALSEAMLWGTIGILMAWSLVYTRAIWQGTLQEASR